MMSNLSDFFSCRSHAFCVLSKIFALHEVTSILCFLPEVLQFQLFIQISFIMSSTIPGCTVNMRKSILFLFVVVVQSLSRVQLFVTPWTAARQASLSFTISWSLLKLMSIESMMPSNHLILCHPLLLLPSIFPSIRIFSNNKKLISENL